MKECLKLLLLAIVLVPAMCLGQNAGTEYMKQVDFGDTQGTTYPTSSGQWVFLTHWEPVQLLGNETDWFGPNYKPLGNSSHPRYVMLDDDDFDYGAISGNIKDLEYRLVNCDFSYHLYNETDTNAFYDGGTLYVVLAASAGDIRGFDASSPAQFEASGSGQVLFEFDIPGGFATSLSGTWGRLSQLFTSAARTRYALGLSPTGTPGSPFTEVGLVWRSDGFRETRICIDDFSLTDVCPNCFFYNASSPRRGCFDQLWTSPFPNNYYYYSVEIWDSVTNEMIFREIHAPARFSWDGIGNQGVWNGVLIPYGMPLMADITYYSCFRSGENVEKVRFELSRVEGCIDPPFGGQKTIFSHAELQVYPSLCRVGGEVVAKFTGPLASDAVLSVRDALGRETIAFPIFESRLTEGFAFRLPQVAAGVYLVQLTTGEATYCDRIIVEN